MSAGFLRLSECPPRDLRTRCLPQDRYCATLLGPQCRADQACQPLFRLPRVCAKRRVRKQTACRAMSGRAVCSEQDPWTRVARDAREPCVCLWVQSVPRSCPSVVGSVGLTYPGTFCSVEFWVRGLTRSQFSEQHTSLVLICRCEQI